MSVRLVIRPRPDGRHYDVEYEGALLVSASADPEHAAARALLAKGITGPAETIDVETGEARLRFDIEAHAATRTVERDSGRITIESWRPRPSGISHRRSGKRDSGLGACEVAGEPTSASSTTRGRTG